MSLLPEISDVRLFNSNLELYGVMIEDMRIAQKSIYFEIYRITKEPIGQLFRDELAAAAKRGVRVVVLIDAWGTGASLSFFQPIIEQGGQVRAFNTLRPGTRIFTQSHRRNHRKIITIDDRICYVGSSNISYYSVVWRELMLRLTGTISKPFRHIIELDFKTYQKYAYTRRVFTRVIHFRGFEIIRDVPSIYKQKVMRKFLYLIKNAKESVYIETPYFLPGYRLRKAMADACQRGVQINVVMPKNSDVLLVDVLRNKYLGQIHKSGVDIHYYYPNNLHSKLMLVDNGLFCVGSSNFDYRSFRYMHEVVLLGKNEMILDELLKHKEQTLQTVQKFDYEFWRKRPRIEKLVAWLLVPFRFFF
jgi:cardiolipin synthase A/B